MKAYYTLAVRRDGRWEVDFGDYDRAVVESEREDTLSHFVYSKDMKIVKSADDQASINLAVAKLNK
jgi:hypothetical protein